MTSPRSGRPILVFCLAALAVSLLVAVVLSNFGATTPDGLQRTVINSLCQDAVDEAAAEECLAEQEGEQVVGFAPPGLAGYENTPLSGFVGVLLCLAVGLGLAWVIRRSRGNTTTTQEEASGPPTTGAQDADRS